LLASVFSTYCRLTGSDLLTLKENNKNKDFSRTMPQGQGHGLEIGAYKEYQERNRKGITSLL